MDEAVKEMEATLKSLNETGALGYSNFKELISLLNMIKIENR